MAIKVDRPGGGAGDDAVVFVARSLDEARRVRAALDEAGVPVDLPDPALELMFQAEGARVPVRVASRYVGKALITVGRLFPPDDDDDDDDRDEPPPPVAAAPSPSPPSAPPLEEAAAGPGADELDAGAGERVAAHRRRAQEDRVAASALKVLFISAASLLLPGIGLPFALFALFAAGRGLGSLPAGTRGRGRLQVALAIGLAAIVWQALLLWRWREWTGLGQ